jgi:hypothetical protein
MMNRRAIVLILLCVACQSCSSDAEKFTVEVKEATSWVASAQKVSEAYANGAAPEGYTRKALASFGKELQSSAQRMQSLADGRKDLAISTLQLSNQTLAQMETKFGDRAGFAQLNVQLANQQTALAALTNPKPESRQP